MVTPIKQDDVNAPVVIAHPPLDLLTDGGIGASRRVRVDPGQTGFFNGKMFRSYIETTVPVAGPSLYFRFTSPIDFILWNQELVLCQGAINMKVYTGATPSGTWTQRPVIGVNRMNSRPSPYYTSVCALETGGTFTGGTEVDSISIRTAAQNNSAQNVGGSFTERGLPLGAYYGVISTLTGGLAVNDAAQFIYRVQWEERP